MTAQQLQSVLYSRQRYKTLMAVAEQSLGLDGSMGIRAVASRTVPVGLMLEEVAPGQGSESTSVCSVSIVAPLLHIHSLTHSLQMPYS
jgi:hypothetical protein